MKRILFISLLIAAIAFAMIATVHAQWSGGYDLAWSTIDGGGGSSSSNGYALAGTIGQPDAIEAIGGGGYTLAGGFWNGGSVQYNIYLPLVVKQ
jgi:hypothetical protein